MSDKQYKSIIISCLKNVVCTKNINYNNYEFLKGVVEPYKKMEFLLDALEKGNNIDLHANAIEALNLLKNIFDTKKVPFEEQVQRFSDIVENIKENDDLNKQIEKTINQIFQIEQ